MMASATTHSAVATGSGLFCNDRWLDLSRPAVMGTLNLTPDSFSDGGRFLVGGRIDVDAVTRAAEDMVASGAALIDIGGESTRPGATPVEPQQEMDRVLPVAELLCNRVDAIVSVDTSSPVLMREAALVGVGMLNDVRAFSRPGALATAAATRCALCLVHMQGAPESMQWAPHYRDVIAEVAAVLSERVAAATDAGVAVDRLVLDPGFGFGKTLEHNLELLRGFSELRARCLQGHDVPLLVGISRKSMLGQITGLGVRERLVPGAVAAAMAVERGARIVRTHDVAETVAALAVVTAVVEAEPPPASE